MLMFARPQIETSQQDVRVCGCAHRANNIHICVDGQAITQLRTNRRALCQQDYEQRRPLHRAGRTVSPLRGRVHIVTSTCSHNVLEHRKGNEAHTHINTLVGAGGAGHAATVKRAMSRGEARRTRHGWEDGMASSRPVRARRRLLPHPTAGLFLCGLCPLLARGTQSLLKVILSCYLGFSTYN